jgi:tripartite-type tricarboxylate transporter receptor subunit TctC
MAKAKPGSLAYASAGNGASNHLAGELFKTIVGIDTIHVPYKGDSPALIGLMGGETQYMFATNPAAISFINSGKLNALGVTSPQRSALTPDVPTFAEFGIKNFYVNVWAGVLAPIGTPQHIVNKLSNEIIQITKLDSVQKQLLAQGVEPNPLGSAAFGMVIKSDLEIWREVAKSAAIVSK